MEEIKVKAALDIGKERPHRDFLMFVNCPKPYLDFDLPTHAECARLQ